MTLTDTTGKVVGRERYSAFGERRRGETPPTTDRLYTGQRLNALSNLYHYSDGTNAGRFYDPLLARFIQPDSVTPGKGSQALNRYAYAYNSPLNYADADGHVARSDDMDSGIVSPVVIRAASPYDPLGDTLMFSWFDAHPGYDVTQDPYIWDNQLWGASSYRTWDRNLTAYSIDAAQTSWIAGVLSAGEPAPAALTVRAMRSDEAVAKLSVGMDGSLGIETSGLGSGIAAAGVFGGIGRASLTGQELVDDIVQNELRNVRLSGAALYVPDLPAETYGMTWGGDFLIGPLAINSGRIETARTIVHEEMHLRINRRAWDMSVEMTEGYVDRVMERFTQMVLRR